MKGLNKWLHKKDKQPSYYERYERNDANRIFEDLEFSYIKKIKLKRQYQRLGKKEEASKIYKSLRKDEMDRLSLWVSEHKEVNEKKRLLQDRVIRNSKALYILEAHENSLPELIEELKEVERKIKQSEKDIFYLQEEKEGLKEEREYLVNAYKWFKGMSILLGVGIAVMSIMLLGMIQTFRQNTGFYISMFVVGSLLIIGSIMLIKSKIQQEFKTNKMLQQKAARYLHKAKTRYFHNFKYLEFQFDKLEIDSITKLEIHYNRYVKNNQNHQEYNKYSQQLIMIENQIQDLFAHRGIFLEGLEHLEEWMLVPQQSERVNNLLEEKQKVLEQIKSIEAYEKELIESINLLGEEEKYKEWIQIKMKDYKQLMNTHLDKTKQYA